MIKIEVSFHTEHAIKNIPLLLLKLVYWMGNLVKFVHGSHYCASVNIYIRSWIFIASIRYIGQRSCSKEKGGVMF